MFNPDEYIRKVMTRMHGEQAIEGKMGPMNFYERIELLCAYMSHQLTEGHPYNWTRLAKGFVSNTSNIFDSFSGYEVSLVMEGLENAMDKVINSNRELFRMTDDLQHTYFEMYTLRHRMDDLDNISKTDKPTRLHFQSAVRKVHPYKNGKGYLVVFEIKHAMISDITANENGRLINKGRRWTEKFKMMLNNTENGVRVMYVLPKNKIVWGYQDYSFYKSNIGSWIHTESSDAIREIMSVSSFIPMAKYYKLDKFDTTLILNDSFNAAKFVTDRADLGYTFKKQEDNAFEFVLNSSVMAVLGKHKGTKGVLNYQYDKTGAKFLPKDAFAGMSTLVDLTELYEAAMLTKLFRSYDPHVFSRYAKEMRELVNINKWNIKGVSQSYGQYGPSTLHGQRKLQYSQMEYIMKFFGHSERILKIALSAWSMVEAYAEDQEGRVYDNTYTPVTFLKDTVSALKSIKSRTVRNAIREHFRNHPEMNDIKLIHDYVSAEAQKIASANVDLTKGKYYERFNGHKIEFIKEDGSKDHVTMVCAPETHELIKWGTSYNICIGLEYYRNAAKNNEVILVAFERSGDLDYDRKYIGFAEIRPNSQYKENLEEKDFEGDPADVWNKQIEFKLSQLLGHSNRILPDIERNAITEFLKNELNVELENGYW